MDTQDLVGSHSELREQKNNVSSSGEEDEEGEDAAAAAADPKTISADKNPGFRIVDIEMTRSGIFVQPGQMSQTTAATTAVTAAATLMNLNRSQGPLPQTRRPSFRTQPRTTIAPVRIRYRAKAAPVHPRN